MAIILQQFITIILIIATLLGLSPKKTLYAKYYQSFSYLKSSYDLFYGSYAKHIYTLPVELDFYYNKIILTNEQISESGIYCTDETYCMCKPVPVYIYDNTQAKNLLETHSCSMPVYINAAEVPTYCDVSDVADFYLKSDIKYYRHKNVVGLDKTSAIYKSLGRKYKTNLVQFTVKTSFPFSNADQLLENYSRIHTVISFLDLRPKKNYHFSRNDSISFKNTGLTFGIVEYTATKAFIDYNLPFIMKLPTSLFERIIVQIKQIICIHQQVCETETDLILNYDRSQQIEIMFPGDTREYDLMVYKSVTELFYIDRDSTIKYNIVASTLLLNEITLGLLFMNTLEFEVTYNVLNSSFSLVLSFKQYKTYDKYYQCFLILSVLISILLCALLLKFCQPDIKPPVSSHFGNNSII